jgi:hypothetical protein
LSGKSSQIIRSDYRGSPKVQRQAADSMSLGPLRLHSRWLRTTLDRAFACRGQDASNSGRRRGSA